jgi:predicted TPR repeat methyltransferase
VGSFQIKEKERAMGFSEYEIEFPSLEFRMDQREEWIIVHSEDSNEKICLHDYARFYKMPGLYEEVIYKHLKCNSPQVICGLLKKELEKKSGGSQNLRALDFGAGNGIVGEYLKQKIGCDILVGVDIIPEAFDATQRDRPGIYDDYYVMDLSQPKTFEEKKLEMWNFNMLLTVGALGFNDIPTRAFINALNIVEDDAWVAFNIKDKFLSKNDDSGFKNVLDSMVGDSFHVLQMKRYCHRLSISGEPLHYHAIVGKKMKKVVL